MVQLGEKSSSEYETHLRARYLLRYTFIPPMQYSQLNSESRSILLLPGMKLCHCFKISLEIPGMLLC